jgi:Asp-tRNA(Asn)/Glu-tRNA(Gln) amidotransferase A subunit family amidase
LLGSPLVAPTGSGALDAVRLAVKDLVPVAGHPIGAGNPVVLAESEPAAAHAPVLARLLAAGAEVRGIARTDELAYSLSGTNVHYGSPVNPWGAGLAVGGSTSGPASAVARGLADVGWAPTPRARSGCRRPTAGCTGCGRRTAPCRWTASCRSRRASTPSAG